MRKTSRNDRKAAAPSAKAPPLRSPLRGSIDRVDPGGLVTGWCAWLEKPFRPRRVAIVVDGVPVQTGVICNLPMALVAKHARAAVGGYDHVRFGWEDYDVWCRFAEPGMGGTPVADVLCEYRVHARSMLRRSTDVEANKRELAADLERRHHWVSVAQVLGTTKAAKPLRRTRQRRARATLAAPVAVAAATRGD